MNTQRKLYKKHKNHKIFGVCSGLAEYFNCNVWTFRILLILLTIIDFKFVIIIYIAFSLVMRNEKF